MVDNNFSFFLCTPTSRFSFARVPITYSLTTFTISDEQSRFILITFFLYVFAANMYQIVQIAMVYPKTEGNLKMSALVATTGTAEDLV